MENNNGKKYYTFIAINKCVGKNGGTFNDIAAVLNISNIQVKNAGGKNLVTARAAINNRTKLINDALGCNLVDRDGVLWVDINFWEDRADRFQKFIGNQEKARLCIVGAVSARKYAKQDGTEGETVTITVNDWFGIDRRSDAPQAAPQGSIPQVGDDDLPY